MIAEKTDFLWDLSV